MARPNNVAKKVLEITKGQIVEIIWIDACESRNVAKLEDLRIEDRKATGIVRDFHMHTMHTKIRPTAFFYDPENCRFLFIRVKPGKEDAVIKRATAIWMQLSPPVPLEYLRFDDELRSMYKKISSACPRRRSRRRDTAETSLPRDETAKIRPWPFCPPGGLHRPSFIVELCS